MGAILDQLNFNHPSLPENLKSRITYSFVIDNEGDLEGIRFVAGRYLDGGLLWANMHLKELENIVEEGAFPRKYEIDAAAIYLAYLCGDNGLSMLASSSLRGDLSDLFIKAANEEGPIFDLISLEEDN